MRSSEQILESLVEFLRIPSVSTDPTHIPDVRRAAEFVRAHLIGSRLNNVRLIEAEGRHPLVYGEWLEAAGKPTLLLYGHYDVQPPDPLDEWTTPPFEPDVRNENIYARGSCDDKGQAMILLEAVRRLMDRDGRLPVNVRFLIEGEEEVGGEHITTLVESKPDFLQADAAVICDTEMFAPNMPTLCVGLRGIVYGELTVIGADHDLHSGVYGGAAPNPIQAIAEILTALKDRDGHILIPGFYDHILPPTAAELEAWSSLPFDPKEYLAKEVGSKELTGEPGFSVLERTWARPTVEVHGIRGGFVGEGAKTVIPARAVAKLSMRLVANQDPAECTRLLQEAIAIACPRGVSAEFKAIHSGAPSLVNTDNSFIQTSAEAMSQVFGKKTVYIRSGGSIPITGLFDLHLGIPSVMMGFGLPDDNLHAPNEKFHLPNLYRGVDAMVRYFEMLGA
jgi:acetylornithine deacetylase/succinyl-diaminopimelate desuccinylase-like protein